jgi:hypothetical protein
MARLPVMGWGVEQFWREMELPPIHRYNEVTCQHKLTDDPKALLTLLIWMRRKEDGVVLSFRLSTIQLAPRKASATLLHLLDALVGICRKLPWLAARVL